MMASRLITTLLAGGLIAACAWEWKNIRQVQRRARSILYPGNPAEMAEILGKLRRYRDDESQVLARQLEERLKIRDRRAWRRLSRRSS
jgi:hypothetical protein